MLEILVDSNVILDVFEEDPVWVEWSEGLLDQYADTYVLCINPIIYAEISTGFERIEELEKSILSCGFRMLDVPREALFLASKVFLGYKKRRGTKHSCLPDFFIGAHAAVTGMKLITRDPGRIKTNFPTVTLVCPSVS